MEGSKNGDDGGAEGVIEAGQSLLNDQTFLLIPLNWGDGEEEFEGRAIFSLLDLDDDDVDDGGVGGWHDVWGSVHNFLHRDSPTFPISSSPLSTSSLLSYLIMKTESILRRNILNQNCLMVLKCLYSCCKTREKVVSAKWSPTSAIVK